jgi:hypothetical protein
MPASRPRARPILVLVLALLGASLPGMALFDRPARAAEAPPLLTGQTLYVSVYSHLLHGNLDSRGQPEQMLLSTLLSIRNTDSRQSLSVRTVDYYDTMGKRIRAYLDQPRTVAPLATLEFFVENKDSAGGSGANFIVVWQAERPINPPLVEGLHSYFWGTKSMAFITQGQPIRFEGR